MLVILKQVIGDGMERTFSSFFNQLFFNKRNNDIMSIIDVIV